MKAMYRYFLLLLLPFISIQISAQESQANSFSKFELINSNLLFNKNIRIVNLGPEVNHEGYDYAPTVTVDGKTIYFVSNRPGSKLISDEHVPMKAWAKNSDYLSHDFWCVRKKDRLGMDFYDLHNVDSTSKSLTGLNTILNEGAASISADGKRLFFTACNRPDGLGDCDIYISYFNGTKWSDPINLGPNVNSKYWDSQPSISPYDKRLYFVSNRPKTATPSPVGFNTSNMDIWYCDWNEETGSFDPAQNLSAVNTALNEFSPFIASDGVTLIFASKGYKPNYGGFDFYVVKYDLKTKTWSKPRNLGEPINTSDDEMFLTMPSGGDIIYFSSGRTDIEGSQGNLDLYMAYLPEEKNAGKTASAAGFSKEYPNPFDNEATIEFSLQKQSNVKIVVNNVYGEEINVLQNGTLGPNTYKITWDSKNSFGMEVPSGVYYYTITIESEGKSQTETNEMVLVR